MQVTLFSFEEAFKKLKNKEIPYLIRIKDVVADFNNKHLLLYKCNKCYFLKWESVGENYVQHMYVRTYTNSGYSETYAKLESDDLLANDYMDISDWIIFKNKKEYNEELLKNNK